MSDSASNQYRVDRLTGAQVVIVKDRANRPNVGYGNRDGCPFCPGGLEAPEPYQIRAFENRWPPFPNGRSEVILYTPDHEAALCTLELDQMELLIRTWSERTVELGSRQDVQYVLIFENRGAESGATISHPHGQIYAFGHIPPEAQAELSSEICVLCAEEVPEALLIAEEGDFRAWVPFASQWPYEVRIAPREHVGALPEMAKRHRELARLMLGVFSRLERVTDQPMPYMMWIHQKPMDGGNWPAGHLHIHIAPLMRSRGNQRFIAAGELGSGTMFNPLPPEVAANDLRRI